METTLEEKVGLKIHNLVRKGKINEAAELAYQEFGFKRAFKIYLNAGRLDLAKKFSKQKGEISNFAYFCGEYKFKVGLSQGPNGPPINYKRKEKASRGLETDVDV